MHKPIRQLTALLLVLVLGINMLPLSILAAELPDVTEAVAVVDETGAAQTQETQTAPTQTEPGQPEESAQPTAAETEAETLPTETTAETTEEEEPAPPTEETQPEAAETEPAETEETVAQEETEVTDGVPDAVVEDYNNQDVLDALEEFRAAQLQGMSPVAKQETLTRYTVLVLDTSGSMYGTAMSVAKKAAVKFCESVLKAAGTNYVAVVKLNTNPSVACTFTSDIDTLTSYINGTYASGGTNTNQALQKAGELLDGVAASSGKVIKNIVVCSDGLPEHGSTSTTGHYTSADHSSSYKYANVAYDTATAIKEKGYYIYSLGFFHSLSGSALAFCQRFMRDIASDGKYYEVIDVEDLEFVFGEISADITVSPYTFKFPSHFVKGDAEATCYYSDGYFLNDARIYDSHLATMSLCFAMTSFARTSGTWSSDTSKADNGGYRWQNAYDLLTELGYDHFEVNDFWSAKPTKDSVGVLAAYKENDYNGVTMIAVGVRGQGYEQEWASNFTVGKTGDHDGFAEGRDNVLAFLKKYIAENGITGEIKIWITGYSRAGCISNMVGGKLVDGYSLGNGATVAQQDLYVYTFEAPMGALKTNTRGDYKNIHNTINLNDIVPMVAPSSWGFARYNIDRYLPSAKLSASYSAFENSYVQNMLTFFEEFAGKGNYNVSEKGSHYSLKVNWSKILPGGDPFMEIVEKDVSKEVILTESTTFLFDGVIGDRNTYYYDFQSGVREIMALCNGGKLTDLLGEGMSAEEFISKFFAELTVGRLIDIVSPMFALNFDSYEERKDKVKENIEDFVKDVLNDSDLWGTVLFVAGIKETLTDTLWRLVETVLEDLFNKNTKSFQSLINLICFAADGEIGQAHYPELTLSWMMSQDSYYEEGQTDFTCTNFRIVHINCPVDVRVYDNQTGRLVAAILDDEAQDVEDSSIISYLSLDGEKIVILPSDGDYSIHIEATDNGTMSYTVDEYDLTGNANSRIVCYYDVPISKGDKLKAYAPALSETEQESAIPSGSSAEYTLYDNSGNSLSPSREVTGAAAENAVYTVSISTNNGSGSVYGGGTYTLGSYALVSATPMNGASFLGWYEDGTLVSGEEEYRFVMTEDTQLVAHFGDVELYVLNVIADGDGSVTNTQVLLPADTQIQLEAIPEEADGFIGWSAEAGTFEDSTSATTWYTMPAQDVTVVASFRTDVSVTLPQDYIALKTGQSYAMEAVVTPYEIQETLTWTIEDGGETIIALDAEGNVTGLRAGTAYVLATVTDGRAVRTDRCRVDVAEPLTLDGIQLGTTKLTTELYSTDYSEISVLLMLPQNYSVKSNTSAEPVDRGVAISSARFTDAALQKLFRLVPMDDRTLAVVPTDDAVENPGSVKSSYTGTITVTVEDQEYTSDELKLTVKKTEPKLKASIESFNSFYPGQGKTITVTGADVTGISENGSVKKALPDWLQLSDGKLYLTDDAPAKSVSGKAYLLVQTRQWRIPAEIALSVKNTYKALSLKLARSSIKLNAAVGDAAVIGVTGNLTDYEIASWEYRLVNSAGLDVTDTGILAVSFEADALRVSTTDATPLNENYKLYISADGSKEVLLKIKTIGGNPTVKLKVSGSIDLSFPDQAAVVTAVYNNYEGGDISSFAWEITEKKGKTVLDSDAARHFSVEWDGGSVFRVLCADKTQLNTASSYELKLKLTLRDGSTCENTAVLKVKRTSIRLKLSPSSLTLNLRIMDKAEIAVSSTNKAFALTAPVWELLDGTGRNSADGCLDIGFLNGVLTVKTNDETEYGKTYKLQICAEEGAPASTLKITVPTLEKSSISNSLKAYGTLDVIRSSSTVVLTPAYRNCAGKADCTESLEIFDASGALVTDLFQILRDSQGNFLVMKAAGAELDSSKSYKVRLVTVYDTGITVRSALVQLRVKMGTAKLTLETDENTLYAADSNSRVEFTLSAADAALNDVTRVEIKDAKFQDLFEIFDYGDNRFALGFKDTQVDSSLYSGKSTTFGTKALNGTQGVIQKPGSSTSSSVSTGSRTVTLNVFLEGNTGSKANATVKLKLDVLSYPSVSSVAIFSGSADVTGKTLTLDVGKGMQLSAVTAPDNAVDAVTWKSSDSTVVKVDADTGEVTAWKAGTVTITCTVTGSSKSATVRIKVG